MLDSNISQSNLQCMRLFKIRRMIQKIATPSKVAAIGDCTLANFCLSLFVLEENILFEATLFVGKVGKEFFGSAGRSRTWLTQSISVVETVETTATRQKKVHIRQ